MTIIIHIDFIINIIIFINYIIKIYIINLSKTYKKRKYMSLKLYLKTFSNVFFVSFPIIFAQCIYYSNKLSYQHAYFNNNDSLIINSNEKYNFDYKSHPNVGNFLFKFLDCFPMMLFKVFVVIFIVGLWKLKYLERLMKTGIF